MSGVQGAFNLAQQIMSQPSESRPQKVVVLVPQDFKQGVQALEDAGTFERVRGAIIVTALGPELNNTLLEANPDNLASLLDMLAMP